MLKRTNIPRKPKKDNPVSKTSNKSNTAPKTTNKRKKVTETIAPSAKKRRVMKDESTPVEKPSTKRNTVPLRRSARLKGQSPSSPPKSAPKGTRKYTKSTTVNKKNPAQKSVKEPEKKRGQKKKISDIIPDVERSHVVKDEEYIPVVETVVKREKPKLGRPTKLMKSDPQSKPPSRVTRKGFNSSNENKKKTPAQISTKNLVKKEKDFEPVSPKIKRRIKKESTSTTKSPTESPESSRRSARLMSNQSPELPASKPKPSSKREKVPKKGTRSKKVPEQDLVEIPPRDAEPIPVVRSSKSEFEVKAVRGKKKIEIPGTLKNGRKKKQGTNVKIHNPAQQGADKCNGTSKISTNEVHQLDAMEIDQLFSDENENHLKSEDNEMNVKTADGNSNEPHTSSGGDGERNPDDEGDQLNGRSVFSMTEEEFMKYTELVPFGPQMMMHLMRQNFDNRYEPAPKVHFASSVDDWERFKNGTEDKESDHILNRRDDDDDLEIVHEAIKKKTPSVTVNQRPTGNIARLNHFGSLNSQNPVFGAYPYMTQNVVPNFTVPIRRLRPVSTCQLTIPEGFRPYEPPYRDGSRCVTVNNMGWRTNTHMMNEVNPHEYRRVVEFPPTSTMRADVGPQRPVTNPHPQRVYDGRNFQYNSSERFPLYQPGFPVHARVDVMEPAPSVPMGARGFRFPTTPNPSGQSIRIVPKMNPTVNELSNFSIPHEMPYRPYSPHVFVHMPSVQSRNIFVEENPPRAYNPGPDALNNNHGEQ